MVVVIAINVNKLSKMSHFVARNRSREFHRRYFKYLPSVVYENPMLCSLVSLFVMICVVGSGVFVMTMMTMRVDVSEGVGYVPRSVIHVSDVMSAALVSVICGAFVYHLCGRVSLAVAQWCMGRLYEREEGAPLRRMAEERMREQRGNLSIAAVDVQEGQLSLTAQAEQEEASR